MDLSVIFDAIVPDNIKNLPLVKKCSKIFIEQLNRNSQISMRISKLFDVDSTGWIKTDENGNIEEITDSNFLKNSKDILKLGLFYVYINTIVNLIVKLQKNQNIKNVLNENSLLYKNVINFLNSEYLGGLRYFQQNVGTEKAIQYMYAFAKYLETGMIVRDLDIEQGSIFNLRYDGSLDKNIFSIFNKQIAHPCGWLCEYEKSIIKVPVIIVDTVLLDATFENEFKDLTDNYEVIYDAVSENDENVYYSLWLSEQKYAKYSDGIDGKCIEFTDVEYNDYTPDFTEYPPIEYTEKNDFKQVAEIYSSSLEGQYIGTYSASGETYYEKKISVSDTNYDVILLKIPNNYNGISSSGYGRYYGDTEIDPYAKIQYDDGRLTTVIDPEKFSLGSEAGYSSSAGNLKFYFSLNDDNIIPNELKFTFSIRPKFIKNPSEFITYLNNRNYSCPNYWTFFVYNNNAFQYYTNKSTITEDDFFFTSVVTNDYPANYLYYTIGGYYLKARMYLTYNLRNSKQFGYYLVVNNESINDAWNCRDALENTANGIDFKSDYTVIDLTEKGLNEEWIDIEVIVTHFDTTLNVDNNSYTFEVYNQYSNIVFVELFPNIENLKNNDEHVLLFYEQIADFKLYLKPNVEEVLISNLLTENDLNRELTYYTDLGEYGGYTNLTDDVIENGTGYINEEYAEAVKENGKSRHSINHFVDPFELANENGYIIAKPGNIITDIGGSGETNYWFYYSSLLNVFDNRNFAKIDFDIKFVYDREKYISHMLSTISTYQDYLNNSIILQNDEIQGEDPINEEHNRFSEYYNGWYDDPGIVIGGISLNLKVFYDTNNQEFHAWFVFTDSSNIKRYIDITDCFNSGEWTHITYVNNNQNCALYIGDNSVNFRDIVNNRCIVKAYCEYDTTYDFENNKTEYDMYWYMQTANLKQYTLVEKEIDEIYQPYSNIYSKGYIRNGYIVTLEVWNDDPLGYSLLWSNGEITKDIVVEDVDKYNPTLYEVQITNSGGTGHNYIYVPRSGCGSGEYELGFESKEKYDLNKWKCEFDFFNTIEDKRKRPMIVVCGYILEEKINEWNVRSSIECISIGANKTSRQYFENRYPFEDMYELNSEEYNNYVDKWCHCVLEVDNTTNAVSVKIDDTEVYNEVLQIKFNPLKVFFYSYNNGYDGCSYGYKIDNLKITQINK